MNRSKLLFGIMSICLLLGLSSCAEDKRIFGDDIEIPQLTDANTIQFTVDVVNEWRQVEVIAGGGRMAIEWGDGRFQKVEDPESASPITYKYGNLRSYKVRIWAEELDFCSINGVLISMSDLRLGYLPKMKSLDLGGFTNTTELDLSRSCPNVTDINIGELPDLERLDISQCQKLRRAWISGMPKVVSLNLGGYPELTEFYCQSTGLTSLSLKEVPLLDMLYCGYNPQLSAIELNEVMPISSLLVQSCAFTSLDFLNKLPLLRSLNCSNNKLTELDVSQHPITSLNCSGNGITHLSIPTRGDFYRLECHSNQLKAEELRNLFDALPASVSAKPQNYISYYNNPGVAHLDDADTSILFGKRWKVVGPPKSSNEYK